MGREGINRTAVCAINKGLCLVPGDIIGILSAGDVYADSRMLKNNLEKNAG